MGRHLVLEGVGHLDVIPKHPVVTDAQRADTGGFLFPFLYFRQNPADILGKVPGLIQRGVVSLPDDAAFLQRRFAVRVDRGPDQLRYIVQRVYVLFDLPQQGTLYLAQQLPDRRQAGRRHSQGNHILDRRVAVDYPGHQPFQVVYAVQLGGQLADQDAVSRQLGHRVQPPVDGVDRKQRLFDGGTQQPAPHRGLGLIQHPEKRSPLFPAAHRFGQFQVAPGADVQLHILLRQVALHLQQPLQPGKLGHLQVGHQTAQRRHGQRNALQPGQRLFAELLRHDPAGRLRRVGVGVSLLGSTAQPVLQK